MSVNVHNPDQYMADLRQIVAQGRKRLGLLVGAGAPAGVMSADGKAPLIPAVAQLTQMVTAALKGKYGKTLDAIQKDLTAPNIESILSRIRSLAGVIGEAKVHDLDGKGFETLGNAICGEIGKIVNQDLPAGHSPFTDIINWIGGAERQHAVEIFTTNYDLLFEQALERAKVPFFDGFAGASEPFFDPSSVASNDLPARWVRVWKLHGSVGWTTNSRSEVIRYGREHSTHLVFPEHLKYDQTQKAPYAALFDRLRAFLMTPDTLLIATGFSFADAHVSARIDECLAANPSASVFAFQYGPLESQSYACDIASRRPNMSVFAPDRAMINGVVAAWEPGAPPSRDWGPIRAGYWGTIGESSQKQFLLGSFDRLARFFVSSRSTQSIPLPPAEPIVEEEAEAEGEEVQC
jgi:hypothetical protein